LIKLHYRFTLVDTVQSKRGLNADAKPLSYTMTKSQFGVNLGSIL
jgi:hypothetical protein